VTQKAQDFRDWFWNWVYGIAGESVNVERGVVERIEGMVGQDLRALRLSSELKLRFFDATGSDYLLGPNAHARRHGYAARSERGEVALQRQAEVQARRRRDAIRKRVTPPDAYGRCVCGSTAQFRFCCGPRRSLGYT